MTDIGAPTIEGVNTEQQVGQLFHIGVHVLDYIPVSSKLPNPFRGNLKDVFLPVTDDKFAQEIIGAPGQVAGFEWFSLLIVEQAAVKLFQQLNAETVNAGFVLPVSDIKIT
jgi:hypothetical protein